MRSVALDVHLDFCEVAIVENGEVGSAGRIETKPEQIELFASSLGPDDRVALEVTGNAWEIARLIEPHVAQVLVVNPGDTGIRQARAKTDRLDARTLARLLAAGSLDAVWMPDEATWVMRRRLSRRSQLVHARTRAKNEIHAVLMRQLVGRPPVSDLFGVKGRKWLAELELPLEESETVDGCMRQIEFLDSEISEVERLIAGAALDSTEIKRLMSVPGVNVIVAASFLAAIGDISRFQNSRKLVGYLGLDPRVRQSGVGPATHGHISKQGSVRALTKKKLRRLEITAGAERYTAKAVGIWSANDAVREAERELARQAEVAYARTVRDWHAAQAAKMGASATPGRASNKPSKGKAARQTTSP